MIYFKIQLAFLALIFLAVLLWKTGKISNRALIISSGFFYAGIAISFAFAGEWFLSAMHTAAFLLMASMEYRNWRAKKELRKQEQEFEERCRRYDQALEEYRNKRDRIKPGEVSPEE